LQAAILALPPDYRLVVVLVDVQGLTYAEAAQVLGISLGTVKSRLSRARVRLRDGLLARREVLPTRIHTAGHAAPASIPRHPGRGIPVSQNGMERF
jgi:predicted DNA-binding protein (UPF0251 family)